MQLQQIRYFLAVVDHQGINAAAAALRVAQPTVSQAMRELERELGVELFHRLGRGMTLTSAGHALAGPARRIVRDVVAAEGTLVDASGHLRGRLDIATIPSLAATPVAGMVSRFRRAHPKVMVRIGSVESAEAGPALIEQGDYEIVVSYLPLPGDDTLLRVRRLGIQDYCVVFPPGTDIPAEDPLPLEAMPDVPLVVVRRGNVHATEIERAVVAATGVLRRPAAVVENPEARLPFVLAGVGGTFLPRAVAETALRQGLVVRDTDPPIRWAYGLVYDEAALSTVARTFVDLVCSPAGDAEEGPRGG
ncbi:LysR family transcriptional regulator [Actinomadura viridis]|uniref:LysR family transcriptional regulator n=1 Tax=Actinomadura viridis TaxID=58110 RepID=UPI0036B20730